MVNALVLTEINGELDLSFTADIVKNDGVGGGGGTGPDDLYCRAMGSPFTENHGEITCQETRERG